MWLPFPVFLYKRVKQGQKDGKNKLLNGPAETKETTHNIINKQKTKRL
jgi:hypothetical protein